MRGVKAPVGELQYIYSNSESVAAIVESADQIPCALQRCVFRFFAVRAFLIVPHTHPLTTHPPMARSAPLRQGACFAGGAP